MQAASITSGKSQGIRGMFSPATSKMFDMSLRCVSHDNSFATFVEASLRIEERVAEQDCFDSDWGAIRSAPETVRHPT